MSAGASPDPAHARRAAAHVVRQLLDAGHTAYWAGGCVRDMLLDRTPVDYDVATSARPDDVAELFPGSNLTGKCFGVVRVRPDDDNEIEVATFRADHGTHDGRHPTSVSFTDAATDAQRRDFTVNALFYDVAEACVIDLVDGQRDLEAGILRAVGDPVARFREDYLRMLRAARFAATLGFTIEPETAAAIRDQAPAVAELAAERVRDELTRLLTEAQHPGRAVDMLDRLGLLAHVLPEIKAMQGVEQPPEFHPEGDVYVHTLMMLDAMESRDPHLAWAVLLHDVGKPTTFDDSGDRIRFHRHANVGADMAEAILRRLRFANDDIAFIRACVHGHMRTMDVMNMRRSTLRKMVGAPTFDVDLELHRLDCLASHGQLDNYVFLKNFQNAMAHEPVLPDPWLRGEDVLALGIKPGPRVGKLLHRAYEAQLEDRFPDREALLQWFRTEVVGRTARDATDT